jgi:hypothetical protein
MANTLDLNAERIASCACGKVRIKAVGRPIISAVCYCEDCQAAVRQLQAQGAREDFHDAWLGSGYATYRDDRLRTIDGLELLEGFKLDDRAPTTRYITTCCKSAMYLKHGPGWWTSVYRVRLGDAAPPIEVRSKVGRAKNPDALPKDVPQANGFPLALIARLLRARIEMWLNPAARNAPPDRS